LISDSKFTIHLRCQSAISYNFKLDNKIPKINDQVCVAAFVS
jgi:hypothetical protein